MANLTTMRVVDYNFSIVHIDYAYYYLSCTIFATKFFSHFFFLWCGCVFSLKIVLKSCLYEYFWFINFTCAIFFFKLPCMLIGNVCSTQIFSYYFICDVIVNCTFVLFEHAFGKMTNPFIYLVFWLDLHLIITLWFVVLYTLIFVIVG